MRCFFLFTEIILILSFLLIYGYNLLVYPCLYYSVNLIITSFFSINFFTVGKAAGKGKGED